MPRSGDVRYEPNYREAGKLMGTKVMQDTMVAITQRKYLSAAVLISPRGSGRYASSFGVDRGMRTLGSRFPVRRSAAILYNSAPYSGKVESAHHVLGQIRAAIRQENR